MKCTIYHCLPLAVVLILGCASMQTRWKKADSSNTIEAYEEFLRRYPESGFSPEARSRIETLRFEEARQKDQIACYEEFIKDYPESKFFQEVKNGLDNKIAFLRTCQTKKVRIEEQKGEFDLLLASDAKEVLAEMGFGIVTLDSTDFDAKLRIGPIKRGIPRGVHEFRMSLDSKESLPVRYAYFVTLDLSHQQAGAIFEEDIWGDYVKAKIPPGRAIVLSFDFKKTLEFKSVIKSDFFKKRVEESLRENLKSKIRELFAKYLGVNK